MKIADSHAHIFPTPIAHKASGSIGDFYDIACKHDAGVEELVESQQKAGISYSVVSSSATSAAQVASINSFIAKTVKEYPSLVGLGAIYPIMDNWEEAVEQIQELGLHGVKVHSDFQKIPIDEPKAIPIYRALAKAGLPVLFHVGDFRYDYSAPERLINLIRQVPDLIAVAAHFGGWGTWEHSDKLQQPENVFFDTSSSLMYFPPQRAREMMEKKGMDHFLFGSDFPMWDPAEEFERFQALELDDSTAQTILFGNFEKIFLKK